MRTSATCIGALAAALLVVAPASAQQQQPHPQQNNTHPTHPVAHYPMAVSQYEVHVGHMLTIFRKARPMGPITQGDLNKAILMIRDCASNAEADGVVTANEAKACNARLTQFKRERLREVMANSSPADWARWRAALPNTGDSE